MTRRFTARLTTALVALLVAAAAASAQTTTPHYYLALGDSLSQGMQPNVQGVTLDTNQGYANDLLVTEQKQVKNLTLMQLGCGGDTTTSMLTGQGNTANAKALHCDRKGGSQVAAAVGFLKAHHKKGEVPLITVDIGANDVDGCTSVPVAQIGTCISSGEASIKKNLPVILQKVKNAAPKGATVSMMTLYDPVLGYYFSANAGQKALASASVAFLQSVNNELTSIDTSGGWKTADVAGAFNSYDTAPTVSYDGQMIPVNVANACSWTWQCTTPPSGPNIHANKNGYVVIAGAFAKVIGHLHK